MDKSDNSIARSELYFKMMFDTCGLEIIHKSHQPGWDPELMPICIWVLKPMKELPIVPKKELKFERIKKMKFGDPTIPVNKNDRTNNLVEKLCDKLVRLEIVDGR